MSGACPGVSAPDYNAFMLLRTLGGLDLIPSSSARPKPLLLLAYLALEGSQERRHLANLFWHGGTDPLNRLAVTLTRLRRADPSIIGANNIRVWTDLTTDAQTLLTALEQARFEEVLDLYGGSFLEGIDFDGWGSELADWSYGTRDFLASQVKSAHLAVAEAEASRGEFQSAAKRAEAAYGVAQTAGLDPNDIARLHTLLLARDHPRRHILEKEAEAFGVKLLTTPREAKDTLQNIFKLGHATPNNLPTRGSTFIGRDLELAELVTVLAREDHRLITLVGTAGVGKTRLGLEEALPDLSKPVVLDENAIINLYTGVGRDYPEAVLSQYNSLFDGTQIGFYGLMQGVSPPTEEVSLEWSANMTASLAAISVATPDFRAYVSTLDVDNDPANGTSHVILNRPEFYTLDMNGVSFADWLGDLVSGREVESVTPSPGDAPASALGESPTVSGTIVNLGRGDYSGKVLDLKAGTDSEDVYATSSVERDGSFSLQLPGAAEMAPRLFDAGLEYFFGGSDCGVPVAPEIFKVSGARFYFHVDGEFPDEVSQTRENDFYARTNHVYVDRDVRAVGTCKEGAYFAGLQFDFDLRQGWNTLIFDGSAGTYSSEDVSAGFRWVLPGLCDENGECLAN